MGSARLMSWILIFLLPFVFTGITILALHHYDSRNRNTLFPVIPERFKGINWVAVFVRTDCDSCRNLLGELSRLLQHHPSANLPLLVLSLDTPQQLFNDQARSALPFRIYACNDYITEPLKVRVVPDVLFINRAGQIVNRFKGRSSIVEKPELILNYLQHGKLPATTSNHLESLESNALRMHQDTVFADSMTIRKLFYQTGTLRLRRSATITADCDCELPGDMRYTLISETVRHNGDSTLIRDTVRNLSPGDILRYLNAFPLHDLYLQLVPDRGAD